MKNLLNATSTPLPSIFGSGFLVIVPILNGAVGGLSFSMPGSERSARGSCRIAERPTSCDVMLYLTGKV